MTGAGYSPTGTVYISYRYYEDHGTDIRYTENKGKSWNKPDINLKEPYNNENYKFNAESPVFDGLEGTYLIKRLIGKKMIRLRKRRSILKAKTAEKHGTGRRIL
ncbi:MAG: hypothetical protein HFE90_04070 [Firmicutes bacterium]|nr:hypothetical protein [Bacillota bacterium]